jgi:hypothetical protein
VECFLARALGRHRSDGLLPRLLARRTAASVAGQRADHTDERQRSRKRPRRAPTAPRWRAQPLPSRGCVSVDQQMAQQGAKSGGHVYRNLQAALSLAVW